MVQHSGISMIHWLPGTECTERTERTERSALSARAQVATATWEKNAKLLLEKHNYWNHDDDVAVSAATSPAFIPLKDPTAHAGPAELENDWMEKSFLLPGATICHSNCIK